MSLLLDPMHRRYLDLAGIAQDARTLEVGCGNGSISAWLAGRIGPGGRAVAIDVDLSLADEFWQGWLAWSAGHGIDYFIGRRLALLLASLGVRDIGATAETAAYSAGSPWAEYWLQTVDELRGRLIDSGKLTSHHIDTFLSKCNDLTWWTQTIAFTAVYGRVPGSAGG